MPDRWIRRRRASDRIGEELRTHIAQRADHIAAEGVPPEEALRRAHAEFGAIEAYEAQCRREHRLGAASRAMNGLSRDFIYAWRRLRATPMFTIFAVVSLAVGIGVTTAMFSIVQSAFWRPSGIPDGDKVSFVAGANSSWGEMAWRSLLTRAEFDQLAASQTSFTSLAATTYFYQAVTTGAASETVQGEGVSGTYFQTIGVRAALGRTLGSADDATRSAVAVVSYSFWKRKLGRDPDVLGRVVRIGGHPFEIVGVASRAFEGTLMTMSRLTEVWIPLDSTTLFPHLGAPSSRPASEPRTLSAIGRLAEGHSAARASAEIAAISKHLDQATPIFVRTRDGASVRMARGWHALTADTAYGRMNESIWGFGAIIMVLVTLVLVVACTNLANLTLARGAGRHHERAIRRAIGGSRWRLVREQSVESGLLALLGGLGGLAVAKAILTAIPDLPFSKAYSIPVDADLSLAAFVVSALAVALALATFGIGPALQLTRGSERADLADGAGSVGAGHTTAQRRAIRSQVIVACGFFIVATAAMKFVVVEARHDPGIDLDRIGVAHINFHVQRWDEPRARRAIEAVLAEAGRQRQLEAVAISSGVPFGTTMTPIYYLARPGEVFQGWAGADAYTLAATPGIFRVLGIDLLHGRTFDQRDTAASQAVVVMGARAALEVFGTTQVVGRDVQLKRRHALMPGGSAPEPETASVIGIVSDTDTGHYLNRNDGVIYRPLSQQYEPSLTIVGRARANPRQAVDAIRDAVRRADPELSINRAGTGFMMLAGFAITARMAAGLTISLGLLALLLSMVGLHGVLAQMVAMRTREVGLRIALGAERRAITRMVLGDGFRPIIQGLIFGLLLGVLGRFVLRATTAPDLSVFDPVGLVIIPIPVLLAGWLACYVPARRAARVDPNVALKAL